MKRSAHVVVAALLWIGLAGAFGEDKAQFPGQKPQGFLLPNGWTITPAGRQVPLTDLPLNIIALADSRRALVATSGYNAHELAIVDLESGLKTATQTVRQSWFGLALAPGEEKIWWSGGGGALLHPFSLKAGKLERTDAGDPSPDSKDKSPKQNFRSGVTLDAKRNRLYSLDMDAGELIAIDLSGKSPDKKLKLGGKPYDVAIARNGSRLYVSDWAGRAVLAVDPDDFRVVAKIGVGEHPNQFAAHPKDDRLFVACANSNNVAVIDTGRGVVTETISTSLFPKAPEGSTPDALCVSPDGEYLFVANADNNCVAVVEVEEPSRSQVLGFIPTGWYPTAVAVTPDGKQLLVGVGKGNQTKPNPIHSSATPRTGEGSRGRPFPYIGTTLSGALSIVPIPDAAKLAEYTETVYRNCPYSDKLLAAAPYAEKTAIPTQVGEPSPIKHVIYIIKENRTFDQVLGDIGRGNCDPALVMFGAEVTPNHHKLANEFVLLDNLYCNGHVSADGHPWSTMAYNTDYVARNWALTYSGREGIDDDDEGDLQKAPSGYLWDACAAQPNLSQLRRIWRTRQPARRVVSHGRPRAGSGRSHVSDVWRSENARCPLARYRQRRGFSGRVSRLREEEQPAQLHRHEPGRGPHQRHAPGTFTPQACVASNDVALGRLVEAVSKSKFWPETAIFVIEDDAQNGPDHVDAHRTVGLVISPYVKRKQLDSAQYTTVSMIRTIELILGLEPLSQFDAAARPMFATFTAKADLTPYIAEAARIDLEAKNTALAYGAERSSKMDFSEYDKIDDFELNEILWRTIKGKDAPLPPAVRQAIAYRVEPR